MPKSKQQIDADHYKKKKEGGWFKFSKWVHKDKIEPITEKEILAFCHSKVDKTGLSNSVDDKGEVN